ncbi:hypothetical protein BGZ97_011012 [Linnemannia gamsii]|jgi:hypothetical protein|uniref:Uncharacterized protein n=1 Tax=Linnemannia gamsii TaxID=64522 RepID=A0A9P6R5Y2_9FUNG|nr:hypothetical protein BGZ97_011012 [Linnemannia gamsii]
MLPTQILRYFRILILFVSFVNVGLIIYFWTEYNVYVRWRSYEELVMWDHFTGHVASLFLTPVIAFAAFGTRPRWLSSNLRFASTFVVAMVLLVAKSHLLHRYLEWTAMIDPVCAEARDAIACRPSTRSAVKTIMGMKEAPCSFLLGVLVIVEAIVTLRMNKRAQDTSKLAAAQDLESNQPEEKS